MFMLHFAYALGEYVLLSSGKRQRHKSLIKKINYVKQIKN